MTSIFPHLLATALLAVIAPVLAVASEDYRCKIERVHSAEGDGPDALVHGERKTWVGREFSVSRKTGAMSGPLRNNYRSDPVIIDPGSKDNSFKVVSVLGPNVVGPGSAVFTLVINEHVETPKKPFVFLSSDVAYFGACWHDK